MQFFLKQKVPVGWWSHILEVNDNLSLQIQKKSVYVIILFQLCIFLPFYFGMYTREGACKDNKTVCYLKETESYKSTKVVMLNCNLFVF